MNNNHAKFAKDAETLYLDALDLLISKHIDYGAKNIADSPGGSLNGKMARINNLIDNDATPNHESLRDSFIDLLNYSAIALMVIDGTWPNE